MHWLNRNRYLVLGGALPLLLLLHFYLAGVVIRSSNQDLTASDQGAEIAMAKRATGDWVPRQTDGVRHPLWSWTARVVHTPDDGQFFTNGKWLNTAFCLVFLAIMAVILTRTLDVLAAITWTLLASLGILVVRGAYFQPEPLYYILSLTAMVLGWWILRGARSWVYPVFGVVCGLAYLAKPSLLPFLIVFCGSLLLRTVLSRVMKDMTWKPGRVFAGLGMAFAILAIMLLPLASFSREYYGKPFFNYTKYWMWMDDFMTEAWPWQDKYPGRVQLDQLPESERPSLEKYLARQGWGGLVKRLADGTGEVTMKFFFPEPKMSWKALAWKGKEVGNKWGQPLTHRGIYLIGLAGLVIGLGIWSGRELVPRLATPQNLTALIYVVGLAGFYTLLYGWYYPIGRGDRFMGSLWMPMLLFLVYAAHRMVERKPNASGVYMAVHGAIILSVLIQALNVIVLFQQAAYLKTRN